MKEERADDWKSLLTRAAKIGVVLLTLLVGGIVATAWFVGDQSNLPFDYEGFD